MIIESCTWIGFLVILMGSIGNLLCICVFLRKRFRSSVLTPFFVALLITDCIYLTFRVTKLLYYQETLFQQFLFSSSCSLSLFIRVYGYFAQNAPQIFIPLCHYELYIRFSLLLMSFLAIQRAYDMCISSFRLIQRSSSSRSFSFVLIISAFIIAYVLEFFGLSIFCSYELSSNTAFQWYDYLYHNLSNETIHLTNFIQNQSANQTDIDCMDNNRSSCSHEQIAHIARKCLTSFHRCKMSFLIVSISFRVILVAKKFYRERLNSFCVPSRAGSHLYL
jgi:archaellum component FlaF (FlaF/FlaG flagellin family)